MKKGFSKFWRGALSLAAAFALTSWTTAHTFAKGGHSQAPLFPAYGCHVTESMEDSRDFFASHYSLIRTQGILPWPDLDGRFSINGIWLNSARGTYAVVKQIEHRDSPRYGALVANFYSACNHQLLASGIRVLNRRDWDSAELSIPLKNYKLNGTRLRAYIRVIIDTDHPAYGTLDIHIRETRYGTRDHFYMSRFE